MGEKHFILDILKPLKLYSSDSSLNGMYMGCEIRIYFPLGMFSVDRYLIKCG